MIRSVSRLPGLALLLIALAVPYGTAGPAQPPLRLADSPGVIPPTGWAPRPPVQIARVGLDVATVNGNILAVGGFNPAKPGVSNAVESSLVDGDGTWRRVASMATGRANAAAAELGGLVYVVGGFTDEDTLDVVEAYDPATGGWSTKTSLPTPRGAAGAASLGGLLYVAGGLLTVGGNDEITASVLVYNPQKAVWAPVAPMPTARWRLRLVAAGGRLYAIGGQSPDGTTLSTVERYDPKTNTWTAVASMTQDRGVPGVVAVTRGTEGDIVVVGGCQFVAGQRRPFLRTTEIYNLATGEWRPVAAPLPHGRCSLGAAVTADGSVLAISGADDGTGTPVATAEVDALKL
jgi:N-acetylneuraminic acid mutarotase